MKSLAQLDQGTQMKVLNEAAIMLARSGIASRLGQSFGGKRDLYVSCGYPKELVVADLVNRYQRQDIARTAVTAYPKAVWRRPPEIFDSENTKIETEFEKGWKKLVQNKKLRLWQRFRRLETLCEMGSFAVLIMGFKDTNAANQELEVKEASELLYLQTYGEAHVSIKESDKDPSSARYGLPVMYTIKPDSKETSSLTRDVHYTRVIHASADSLTSDVTGDPIMELIYNRLQDLEVVTGGGSEMFWRGAFGGMALKMPAEAELSEQSKTDLKSEVEAYQMGLSRVMRLVGVEPQQFSPTMANPQPLVSCILRLIAAATGIPERILTGSERGELASNTDQENWDSHVDERRTTFSGPMLLAPFVDRLIEVGILPAAKDEEYKIEWPEINAPNKKERMEVAKLELEAYNAYIGGANQVLPFDQFLVNVLGKTQDEADAIMEAIAQQNEDLAEANPDQPQPVTPGAPKPAPKMVPAEEDPKAKPAPGKAAPFAKK